MNAPWKEGRLQVYTGDGKGKTTAALGLALRAAGAGARVFFAQFIKGIKYNEIRALERFDDLITVRQYGRGCFIRNAPTDADKQAAMAGLREARQVLESGEYPMVILDEANVATHFGLFPVEELLNLIHARPNHVELILTGRRADPRVIEQANLVTEMREIRHYYAEGLEARDGIER